MSRTKDRTESVNPAKKFIKLSGITGKYGYWDKASSQTIELEYPIRFVILDVLSTIKGFHTSGHGIYSNEVHSVGVEPLNVRIFDEGDLAKGFYKDIKDKIKSKGGKFCNSVYAMRYDADGKIEMVNFQMMGASLFPFIEFTKAVKIYDHAVVITEALPAKKGATKYFVPVFDVDDLTDEEKSFADEMDMELQDYLDSYKLVQLTEKKTDVDDGIIPNESEDVPF